MKYRSKNNGLSVVLVLHNEEASIPFLVQELVKQAASMTCCELLLIDNASTDNTLALLKSFRCYSFVRVLSRLHNNLGAARAQALVCSKYAFVVFLDGDCVPGISWLRDTWHATNMYFNSEQDLVALAGNTIQRKLAGCMAVGGQNQDPFCDPVYLFHHKSWQSLLRPHYRLVDKPEWRSHMPTAQIVYRAEKVIENGNFNEDLDCCCEDLELNNRLRNRGLKILAIPDISVYHSTWKSPSQWFFKCLRYARFQWLAQLDRSSSLFKVFTFRRIFPILWPLLFPIMSLLDFIWFSSLKGDKKSRMSGVLKYILFANMSYFGYFLGGLRGLVDRVSIFLISLTGKYKNESQCDYTLSR